MSKGSLLTALFISIDPSLGIDKQHGRTLWNSIGASIMEKNQGRRMNDLGPTVYDVEPTGAHKQGQVVHSIEMIFTIESDVIRSRTSLYLRSRSTYYYDEKGRCRLDKHRALDLGP